MALPSPATPFPPSALHPVRRASPLLAGLLLSAAVAAAAIWLGEQAWAQSHGLGALTLAIVLGMLVGNTLYPTCQGRAQAGVVFSKTVLLRTGIVLYGLRLTFQDVAIVGAAGLVIDALMLASTFAIAWFLGRRLLGLDAHTTLLIGAGSSICGAAAIMAAEPVVRGRADQAAVAVATVVVFGTVAMFAWPALYHAGILSDWFGMTPAQYGVFVGSTVHEVAQVVVAGGAAGIEAADAAVIAKMARVMMLAPVLLLLAMLLTRREAGTALAPGRGIAIPWFAFGFIAVTGLNSVLSLPEVLVAWAIQIDGVLLAMAMAALGMTTHVGALRRAGGKPMLLGLLLLAWLLCGGVLLNGLVQHWLG